MRALLQRGSSAQGRRDIKVVGEIDRGYVVFLGVGHGDDEATADTLLAKIEKLRIFADEAGKSNLSLHDIDGEMLVVSQFTLYADTRKGNRPSFTTAMPPAEANRLYEYFVAQAKGRLRRVETGAFGADMQVSLVNDGPFTIWIDTDEMHR